MAHERRPLTRASHTRTQEVQPRPAENPVWRRLATRVSGGGGVPELQRQSPPAAATPGCLGAGKATARTTDTSDLFYFSPVTEPCLACPDSDPWACPKLADYVFPPIMTDAVQFSWQMRFGTFYNDKGTIRPGPGKKTHVVQKIEVSFNFATAPAGGYNYTPLYWEAFALEPDGTTTIDHWQFELPDGTSGDWRYVGTVYLTEQLPAGMTVGAVAEAHELPSTTTEPKGLGRVVGTRQIGAK
jgi:hypothetical protein